MNQHDHPWMLAGAVSALVMGSAPAASAQAVQEYEYQPERIYTVRAGLGITTQIELSPEERILDFSTGFTSGWDLSRRDNVFYLKPKNIDVDTNMMVRTATHSYIFELKVVATDWRTLEQARNAGVQYRIKFSYPGDTSFSKEGRAAAESPALSTALLRDRSYNFNYDYASQNTGAPWLVPVNVYDDGRFTYIRLNDLKQFPTGNFPAVYMRQKEHDEDSVVNSTVEGSAIVVHGTYPYLVIRQGDNVVGLRRNTAK